MSSFLALSVSESAPALTAPAAAETPFVMPLTTFLSPLFRRPSFLFLGVAEDDPPPLEELEDGPVPDDEELPLSEELEEPVPDDEELPLSEEELEEPPPEPCLPLSYPFLAALLTALPALTSHFVTASSSISFFVLALSF